VTKYEGAPLRRLQKKPFDERSRKDVLIMKRSSEDNSRKWRKKVNVCISIFDSSFISFYLFIYLFYLYQILPLFLFLFLSLLLKLLLYFCVGRSRRDREAGERAEGRKRLSSDGKACPS
jgi:hypothetical protein